MARDPQEVLAAVIDQIHDLITVAVRQVATLPGGTDEEITAVAHRDAFSRVLDIINEEQIKPPSATATPEPEASAPTSPGRVTKPVSSFPFSEAARSEPTPADTSS